MGIWYKNHKSYSYIFISHKTSLIFVYENKFWKHNFVVYNYYLFIDENYKFACFKGGAHEIYGNLLKIGEN